MLSSRHVANSARFAAGQAQPVWHQNIHFKTGIAIVNCCCLTIVIPASKSTKFSLKSDVMCNHLHTAHAELRGEGVAHGVAGGRLCRGPRRPHKDRPGAPRPLRAPLHSPGWQFNRLWLFSGPLGSLLGPFFKPIFEIACWNAFLWFFT